MPGRRRFSSTRHFHQPGGIIKRRALAWTAQEGNGVPEWGGGFLSPGHQRSGGGLGRFVEALLSSSVPNALESYFRPQPKSATANYTANNGERASSARLDTPDGLSSRAERGAADAAGGPSPSPSPSPSPRGGSRGGGGAVTAGAGRPAGPRGPVAGLLRVQAPRGGRSLAERAAECGPSGTPRRPRRRAGTDRTVGWDLAAGLRRPLRSPFSSDRGREARARGSRPGREAGSETRGPS